MYPKISFITVVRNDKQGLERTLENISSIAYTNKEVIVIDGGSTDGSKEVAQRYAHDITYFVSEPDGGLYFAMNKGLRAATGHYVWFVNAGDRVVGFDALYRLLASDNPLPDICYGDTRIVSPQGQTLGLRRKVLPEELTWRSLQRGMVVCHQSILVAREIAPQYDTKYSLSADFDWVVECLMRAKRIANVGAVLSEFELGGLTTQRHRESLWERWHIMCKRYGVVATFLSHIRFVFDAIFAPSYR